jgi:hypothetical protein
MNLQIAQAYLQHSDTTLAKRTWQDVMDAMAPLKTGPTLTRWKQNRRTINLIKKAAEFEMQSACIVLSNILTKAFYVHNNLHSNA